MATKQKNTKFMKPLTPSTELAAIVGKTPLPRTQVIKKLWSYIKKNGLQDKKQRRFINPDEKLGKVIGNKKIDMFQMTKKVSKHLS